MFLLPHISNAILTWYADRAATTGYDKHALVRLEIEGTFARVLLLIGNKPIASFCACLTRAYVPQCPVEHPTFEVQYLEVNMGFPEFNLIGAVKWKPTARCTTDEPPRSALPFEEAFPAAELASCLLDPTGVALAKVQAHPPWLRLAMKHLPQCRKGRPPEPNAPLTTWVSIRCYVHVYHEPCEEPKANPCLFVLYHKMPRVREDAEWHYFACKDNWREDRGLPFMKMRAWRLLPRPPETGTVTRAT